MKARVNSLQQYNILVKETKQKAKKKTTKRVLSRAHAFLVLQTLHRTIFLFTKSRRKLLEKDDTTHK